MEDRLASHYVALVGRQDRKRNNSNQSTIPVMMVTTGGDAGKLAAVQQDGVSAIVDEPFEITEVKHLIEAALTFEQVLDVSLPRSLSDLG